ncbi:pyridoxamine 5'-phosphate oxidase family protein [Microbacterium betulae]|uniref:Pyridoxamine 5'-phosphate oxidase family protein n=1 Tax=Microbacterium betulae TaxID=2981139 RepID=A0AA97I7R5_9MICO|nr:pyridoxamine 5'-phosphate oxidase family protein [Microbacterium sp. AB]WOF23912.1 pyridoxamine 5'-phosphate oxidase family protein [Microbacterium sp. AB]
MIGAPGNIPPADLERPVQDGALPEDPFALLMAWAPSNDDPVRPTATLATLDADGLPDARTVLLSAVTSEGASFHTDAGSRKAGQLAERPTAALVVRWEAAARQVVLRGGVERSVARDARDAYARRGRYLQVLAWMNTPDVARLPRAEREERWAAFDAAHPDLDAPETWAGFVLRPQEMLFWEGSAVAPSRRARYRRRDGGWALDLLPG